MGGPEGGSGTWVEKKRAHPRAKSKEKMGKEARRAYNCGVIMKKKIENFKGVSLGKDASCEAVFPQPETDKTSNEKGKALGVVGPLDRKSQKEYNESARGERKAPTCSQSLLVNEEKVGENVRQSILKTKARNETGTQTSPGLGYGGKE